MYSSDAVMRLYSGDAVMDPAAALATSWVDWEGTINQPCSQILSWGFEGWYLLKKFLSAENVLILPITKAVLNGLDPPNF